MHQAAWWGQYLCHHRRDPDHEWHSLSARKWVTPAVRDLLARIEVPRDERELYERTLNPVADDRVQGRRNIDAEIERLTLGWVKGRLREETYDRQVAALEAERDRPAIVTPPAVQMEVLTSLAVIDLEDRRRETGQAANRILRHLLEPIRISADRCPVVSVREEYRHWIASK